jgi:hypothetical protein
MAETTLREIYSEWEEWAASVAENEMEEGWESDFPKWPLLLDIAQETMMRPLRDRGTLDLLEKCWEISECCEELTDFAREHISECLDLVAELAKSRVTDVRWQAYSALSAAGVSGEAVLRRSLDDPDSYCRRRGYLALAETRPTDAGKLAHEIIDEEGPYMRLAAIELLRVCDDSKLVAAAKARLLADRIPFVRQAAEERLG